MQKTIFITISRSFITRNILRSGTLDMLKKSGHKIIVFFQSDRIPDYLKKEFEDKQVVLFGLQTPPINPLLRRLLILKDYLIFTKSTKQRLSYYVNTKYFKNRELTMRRKDAMQVNKRLFFAKIISKIHFLKPLFRWTDLNIFKEKNKDVKKYFNMYKPDLIFSTSIIGTLDIIFMKEARRRGVKTISMPKSWDNIANSYYRFIPDCFLVPNKLSLEMLPALQGVKKESIYVVGMPVFDWYRKPGILKSRDEHFRKKGLDFNKRLLFFGSEGSWSINDKIIAKNIYELIKNDEIVKPCQLLIRPHFSNAKDDIFKEFRDKKDIIVDDYRIVDFMIDKWDPDVAETIDFINSVMHCDIMINPASTLSLDAACVDKPIINIGFGCEYTEDGKDITEQKMYDSDHMEWMLSAGGTDKVKSKEELKNQINKYLLDSTINSEGREILREKLCFKVDGLSSKRVADAIDDMLSK